MNVTMTMEEYQDILDEIRKKEIKISQLKRDWENMRGAFNEAIDMLPKDQNVSYTFCMTSSAYNPDILIPYHFSTMLKF